MLGKRRLCLHTVFLRAEQQAISWIEWIKLSAAFTSVRKMTTSIAAIDREIIEACHCECRQCGKPMQHVADLPETARFKAASIFRCVQCKCITRSDVNDG